ncbi:hypothetical protein [Tardiphaga sp.]|uniref:hypothetical protein n=1 Tax=Tardiphaga sp. TaxID=1926292 RepID=UPI00261C43B4|nr:hypothetical protein [Tardiphaga sp.]MDB5618454.1 hypothetical protein [Tardiphaga sp.]
MRTGENNSTDWIRIGEAYNAEDLSIRALAKRFGISDTAVRKEAKKRGWVKFAVATPDCEPQREPAREPEHRRHEPRRMNAGTTTKQLVDRGRGIILSLMAELEYLNEHAALLMELVDANFTGEKDAATRAKLLKALDHEVRTKSSNQLATALAKLTDAAPGKKEQAEEDSKTAAAGTEWDDLENTPASVN